jgi:hypothetical protein
LIGLDEDRDCRRVIDAKPLRPEGYQRRRDHERMQAERRGDRSTETPA